MGVAEKYRGRVVAVLEGLRQAVYPHCRLEDFSQPTHAFRRESGWAVGVVRQVDEDDYVFDISVLVEVEVDAQGRPVCFVCRDRHGATVRTPEGDLSRSALVDAVARLHQDKPQRWRQLWRWLGRDRESHTG